MIGELNVSEQCFLFYGELNVSEFNVVKLFAVNLMSVNLMWIPSEKYKNKEEK